MLLSPRVLSNMHQIRVGPSSDPESEFKLQVLLALYDGELGLRVAGPLVKLWHIRRARNNSGMKWDGREVQIRQGPEQ